MATSLHALQKYNERERSLQRAAPVLNMSLQAWLAKYVLDPNLRVAMYKTLISDGITTVKELHARDSQFVENLSGLSLMV